MALHQEGCQHVAAVVGDELYRCHRPVTCRCSCGTDSCASCFIRCSGVTQKLDFSLALRYLKLGHRVARHGWNGKGMWAVLQKGYPEGIAINKNTAESTGIPEGTVCKFRPYLMLYTAQGDFAHWVPSGSDILAEDWVVVE